MGLARRLTRDSELSSDSASASEAFTISSEESQSDAGDLDGSGSRAGLSCRNSRSSAERALDFLRRLTRESREEEERRSRQRDP